ncbi:MAG: S41 family peptidase [Clostridia bacterium]|nr:S41 family peptidase [Clostridia bacterium]
MNSEKKQSVYKIIMLIALTVFITFMVTTIALYKTIGRQGTQYIIGDSSSIGQKIAYYNKFIQEHYIYDIDDEKMQESAIKGYFEGLGDQYSEYITKEEMQDYMADATGKYVGIGVYITNNTKTNQIVVLMPIKGSPSEEAGIKPGDVILKIDGQEYKGEELNEASNKLKAQEGTKVKLEILRNEEKIEIEVERKTIKVNHIESKILENNIGYIQISTFDDGCYKEFEKNYNDIKEKNIKALIIDLRNNGGGIVEEATNIADMFTQKGATLLITTEKGNKEEITKAKKEIQIDIPIVILVNENTASASEILTAAIKENKDNVSVVGTKTYGKGVIQSIFTLKDGSGIKLTTNEYYTPKHNIINKVGITPDYEVELPEGKSLYEIEEEKEDTQLSKAIELLK